MVIKCIYRIYMYKPLLVNVSVSLIVSGVQPHMTLVVQTNVYKDITGASSPLTFSKFHSLIHLAP